MGKSNGSNVFIILLVILLLIVKYSVCSILYQIPHYSNDDLNCHAYI